MEQLADQLSGLDPRGRFQRITHSIQFGAIMLMIILVIIFVVYWCFSTKIVQAKHTQLVRAFFTKSIYSHPQLKKLQRGDCQGTFNFKGSNMLHFLPLCAVSQDSLFLISSWKTGTSRAAHSSQDWDDGKEHLLGFSSVTPFSDSLQWLPSVTPFSDSLQWPCT